MIKLPEKGLVIGINVEDEIDFFSTLPKDSCKGPYEILGELEKTVRGSNIKNASEIVSIEIGKDRYYKFRLISYWNLGNEKYILEYMPYENR